MFAKESFNERNACRSSLMPRCKGQSLVVKYVMWTQRDGTQLAIKNMDDKLLFNTIRQLERNATREANEDTKAANAWNTGEAFEFDPDMYLKPEYFNMVAVAEARGIKL